MIRHAISVRQPMAWAIVAGFKDVENRNRPALFRRLVGQRVLIHTGRRDAVSAKTFARDAAFQERLGVRCPPPDELDWGGIIGSVVLDGIVEDYDSDWFRGPYGLVLRDPERLPFRPCKGGQGAFRVEVSASMIRIAVTQAAFDAICATLPVKGVVFEGELTAKGERTIWLDDALLWRFASMRGPGESYSDVILRLVAEERG
jgi:hypothetical protein